MGSYGCGLSLAIPQDMWRLDRARTFLFAIAGVGTVLTIVWLALAAYHRAAADAEELETRRPAGDAVRTSAPGNDAGKDKEDDKPRSRDDREVSDAARAEMLVRAQLWRPPPAPVNRASLAGDTLDELSCKFKVSDLGGTTPKFDCILESGEQVRIKYGSGPEVPAEAAATQLLKRLGFGADDVALVRRLRCYGCPKEPFSVMKAVEVTRAEALYKQVVDFDKYEEFEWVAVERKIDARPIETDKIKGWSFFELDGIDPSRGGAARAHVDAIRIMAVLLAHWDNKSENQRLVCLTEKWPEDSPCPEPFLLLQDVGATFGPAKLDLAAWEQTPMWADRQACSMSMQGLPFGGATFGETRITEAGRRFTARLLSQLSREQLTELFTYARFAEPRGVFAPSHPVSEWVRVFQKKVAEISAGPPCPAP